MVATKKPGTFKVTAYRCRCGHEWVNRSLRDRSRPKMCPKCKTVNWDRPKRPAKPKVREAAVGSGS